MPLPLPLVHALNVLTVMLPTMVTYMAFTKVSREIWFFYHAWVLAAGYLCLMTQGLLLLLDSNSLLGLVASYFMEVKRKKKIQLHAYVQVLAWAIVQIGFFSQYMHKSLLMKDHFTSWHGLMGLIAIISSNLQLVGGLTLYYYSNLSAIFPLPLSQLTMKKMHRWSACVTYVIALMVIYLSMYSTWVLKNFPVAFQGIIALGVFILALVLVPKGLRLY
eukprot:TRINITY_DN4432_c0_g1_i1.p1 TRINITY_DN4432_c0_g1~~TRINITY_DN4432_c0_g1_i1.p1  ORF type:complete len:244 (+),score=38.22 TRINITY_DN4432_c0_g1_i1:81-734(+)